MQKDEFFDIVKKWVWRALRFARDPLGLIALVVFVWAGTPLDGVRDGMSMTDSFLYWWNVLVYIAERPEFRWLLVIVGILCFYKAGKRIGDSEERAAQIKQQAIEQEEKKNRNLKRELFAEFQGLLRDATVLPSFIAHYHIENCSSVELGKHFKKATCEIANAHNALDLQRTITDRDIDLTNPFSSNVNRISGALAQILEYAPGANLPTFPVFNPPRAIVSNGEQGRQFEFQENENYINAVRDFLTGADAWVNAAQEYLASARRDVRNRERAMGQEIDRLTGRGGR